VHVDAYRLSSLGELDELVDEVFATDAITVIEWGEVIRAALPADTIHVRIEHAGDGRDITVQGPGERTDAAFEQERA
jgi:tRNA A37 threonylcarbamoyladenosine biosynthesis protein TsaE